MKWISVLCCLVRILQNFSEVCLNSIFPKPFKGQCGSNTILQKKIHRLTFQCLVAGHQIKSSKSRNPTGRIKWNIKAWETTRSVQDVFYPSKVVERNTIHYLSLDYKFPLDKAGIFSKKKKNYYYVWGCGGGWGRMTLVCWSTFTWLPLV